jgi:V8-like Glu-specific endopeptidase
MHNRILCKDNKCYYIAISLFHHYHLLKYNIKTFIFTPIKINAMKFKITFLLFLFTAFGFSQVSNEGKPFSWETEGLADVAAIKMPAFDLEKLNAEDKVNDAFKNKPWRYGFEFLVDHNLQNSGSWTTLANGDRIWRIRYYSQGAHTLNFLFSDFYMPKGAKVYLYNNDRTDLLGAYDENQNNEKRVLGTWLVTGEDIWIEYYEPAAVKGQGKLEIFKVVHGYRSVGNIMKSPDNDLNASGSCHYDVNCSIEDINALKDINKKAIGLIIVANNSFCTGALINNTTNDGTPYFLTANHCTEDEDISQWSFRFNWISPNPVCAQNTASTTNAPNYYQTVSGAELKAKRAESDFCLIKLTSTIPSAWDVVWAGWTRSETAPQSTFGIHHPSGDIMKVSRDYDAPSIDNSNSEFMWVVNSWDLGVTEAGSSGSPLFDNNGRIIGQLYGGLSECNGTTGNGEYDIYGRFGKSWDTGTLSSNRLKDWLDPGNTNAQTLNYKENPVAAVTAFVKEEVKIYPNPSNGVYSVTVEDDAHYTIYSILGPHIAEGKFTSGDNNLVNLQGAANGIYMLKITQSNGKTASYKLIKQ